MRRWLAILLLALLPLQFSTAAMAAHCGHESDLHAPHFGHHVHPHAADGGAHGNADPADAEGSAAADVDCGHCHGSCCGVATLPTTLAPPAPASHPHTRVDGTVGTLAPNPPERPQWMRFA